MQGQEKKEDLTTTRAAKVLSVSRQFLVQLLERGQIPFHMVGTHRRVYARDLLAFKAKRDSARRKTLDDLARNEIENGLYDLVPNRITYTGEKSRLNYSEYGHIKPFVKKTGHWWVCTLAGREVGGRRHTWREAVRFALMFHPEDMVQR